MKSVVTLVHAFNVVIDIFLLVLQISLPITKRKKLYAQCNWNSARLLDLRLAEDWKKQQKDIKRNTNEALYLVAVRTSENFFNARNCLICAV